MKNIRLIIGSMSFVFLTMIAISSCKKSDNSYSNSVSDLNSTVEQAK